VKITVLTLIAILFAPSTHLRAAGPPPPVPYTAVAVDKFVALNGVEFPADYQSALAADIARELSVSFPTVIIVHQGDPAPNGHPQLRISGVVTRFEPGNKLKRRMIGFGAGATIVEAEVWFIDASSGQVLLNRGVRGTTRSGVDGGDSKGAADSVAKKIVKFCNSARLLESN
jgi:Domain of unknown function (DUF4410)